MTSYLKNCVRSYKNHRPQIGHNVYIDPHATVIGRVHLAADVSVWPQVVIRGDVNWIRIGARTNIQDGSVIHVARASTSHPQGYPVAIGEDVTVGHKAMVHGCTIGNRVLVGMSAIVLDGAVIEDNVIIGAGALVTPGKHLHSGYLYTGSPAKQSRALRDEELTALAETVSGYIALKNDYSKTAE